MDIINQYISEYMWLLGAIVFLLFIWNIILNVKLTKIKKRFLKFTKGSHVNSLEKVIVEYNEEIKLIKDTMINNSKDIVTIQNTLKKIKGNLAILRYNAFGDEGNDLSYSIAILDDSKNGVVISSIYNRGESNTYAKPIEDGRSTYKLSVEENTVIEKAMSK